MDYRKLGRSDLQVSTICMGCWALAGGAVWGDQDEQAAIAALQAALDVGVNFFDTAEGYGNGDSEKLLGRAFKDKRDQAIIATKVSQNHMQPADLRAACERSLTYLQTDYIDVYYLHWPNWEVPFEETMGEMLKLKDEGKIRYVGCSNFGKQDLTALLDVSHVEVNQLAYNLLFRAIEYEIVPTCVEHDVSIAAYSPLFHGILTGKFGAIADIPDGRARTRHFSSEKRPMTRHGGPGAEDRTAAALRRVEEIAAEIDVPMAQLSLAWLMKKPGVTTVIAGARNPRQIESNAQAAALDLGEDVIQALDGATEPLKQALGANADMWENDENCRIR